jgi:predicted NodU family carbamoyl transferase|tara:strand:- start:1642 stop:2994 length:1353 start_codon:yes stop_codon:yes gene_type:complete
MNILSIYSSHDGCVTYISNNKIVFHTQIDRYNRFKHANFPVKELIEQIEKLKIDIILLSHTIFHSSQLWYEIFKSNKKLKDIPIHYYGVEFHHLFHAFCSLTWNKNLKNIIVCDGAGAPLQDTYEQESYYTYDGELKHILTEFNMIGKKYELFTEKHFFHSLDCGKTMAWSLFDNRAKEVQKTFEIEMHNFISRNDLKHELIFTGGCAQNILFNSKLLYQFKDLFCDPFNGDFGLSLGAANYYTKNKIINKDIYLGIPQPLDTELFLKHDIIDVTPGDVAKILVNDPVAIFQSRSEQGQRGLGNRSLLMNPTHKDASQKLNEIKKREWFRPFACSILKEKSQEWFKMPIEESPYMMYAFDLNDDKKNILTAGISKDNKSRIQTVTSENNNLFFNLLCSFNELTKVPLLINTSLNLPGEVLVETIYDLKKLFDNSLLKYIYLPELQKLIIK